MSTDRLTIGDTVLWRGAWGMHPAKLARVTGIQRTTQPREKYGRPVNSVHWDNVRLNLVCVDLDNGHWAYGEQIEPALDNPAVLAVVVDGLLNDVKAGAR